MKTKYLLVLPALIAVLNLIPAGRVTAQSFTALYGLFHCAAPLALR